MRHRAMWAVAMAAVWGVSSARADITYTFATDASNYTASAGGAVTVNLYLDEAITGGSQAIIGPGGSEAGLFAAGVAANLVSGSSTLSGAAANNNNANSTFSSGNPQSGPGFGGATGTSASKTNVATDGSNAAILDQINFLTPAPKAYNLSNANGTVVNQLFLGSFTVTAGSSGTSTFSVTSFNNSPNSFAQANGDSTVTSPTGDSLDQDGQDPNTGVNFFGDEDTPLSFTVTVAAVPEPNGLVLSGLVAACGLFGGLGFVAYRRGRAFFLKGNAAA